MAILLYGRESAELHQISAMFARKATPCLHRSIRTIRAYPDDNATNGPTRPQEMLPHRIGRNPPTGFMAGLTKPARRGAPPPDLLHLITVNRYRSF
ncbi:MAG: hypothetical protein AB7J13_06060 [Pyrinomonadaceae bacterium]